MAQLNDGAWLKAKLQELHVEPKHGATLGELQLTLFEETTEAELFDPTYIVDWPAEASPLARRLAEQKGLDLSALTGTGPGSFIR